MSGTYEDLLQSKRLSHTASGRMVAAESLHPSMFPFQRDLTRWALAKGRGALFADTGLGKTRMQLEWARNCGERPLLLAPLAVAHQTVIEARELGMDLVYARKQADAGEFTITNYEMVQHFDPSAFGAVVLDESGCLKNFEGKTRTELIRLFKRTPMRLCCTATPAPNDISEIANHAEFLGILSRVEMLATFFVHDDEGWRLKGHAREAFYRWMASWGMSLKKPSDLGYSDEGYDLPPLHIIQNIVNTDATPSDRLFQVGLKGIQDRAAVRKATLDDRVGETLRIVQTQELAYTLGYEPGRKTSRQDRLHEGMAGQQQRAPKGVSGSNQRSTECPTPGTVCARGGTPDTSESRCVQVAEGEPGETKGATPASVRGHAGAIQPYVLDAGGEVRDLRVLGLERKELLPGNGPLPSDQCDPRRPVHELQHGPGKVQGRPEETHGSGGILADREQWIVWCGLNAEQEAIERELGDECVSVYGTLTPEEKVVRIHQWLRGEKRVLISKVSVCGFGMNFQNCSRIAFVGLSDSYEQYYQAIRRCWRFGQKNPVMVHIILSEAEQDIYHNVLRKEREAEQTSAQLVKHLAEFERAEIRETHQRADYLPGMKMRLPSWLIGATHR